MSNIDFYQTLNISPDATQQEIQKAYWQMANKYHPDKHHDNPLRNLAEEQFKIINNAYETLSDPAKRKKYDMRFTAKRTAPPKSTGRPSGTSSTGPPPPDPPREEPKPTCRACGRLLKNVNVPDELCYECARERRVISANYMDSKARQVQIPQVIALVGVVAGIYVAFTTQYLSSLLIPFNVLGIYWGWQLTCKIFKKFILKILLMLVLFMSLGWLGYIFTFFIGAFLYSELVKEYYYHYKRHRNLSER